MQQLAALFGGAQGSPANPCEPRERSVPQWGDQNRDRPDARDGARAVLKVPALPQDVRAGTYCWLATGEPNQFALDLGLVCQACHWNWDFSMFWQICMSYSNYVLSKYSLPSPRKALWNFEEILGWRENGRVGEKTWGAEQWGTSGQGKAGKVQVWKGRERKTSWDMRR